MDQKKDVDNFLKPLPFHLYPQYVQHRFPQHERTAIEFVYDTIKIKLESGELPISISKDGDRSKSITTHGWNLIHNRLKEAGYCCELSRTCFIIEMPEKISEKTKMETSVLTFTQTSTTQTPTTQTFTSSNSTSTQTHVTSHLVNHSASKIAKVENPPPYD